MSLNSGVPSIRTMTVGLVGLGAVAVIRTMLMVGAGGEQGALLISDLGELAVVAVSAMIALSVGRSFAKGEALRRQWTLIGLGMLCFAAGDAVWAWIELGLGAEVPYPGLPDVFYVGEYAFIGVALLLAALAYGRLLDLRIAAGFAVTAGAVMLVLLYFGLLQPYILGDPSIAQAELVASTFYPVADVALLLTPSVLLLMVVSKLGSGRLGWPWWFVAGGAAVLAVSDATFSWMSASDSYVAGAIVDYGWMLAHVLLAVGACVAADIARPSVVLETPASQPAVEASL